MSLHFLTCPQKSWVSAFVLLVTSNLPAVSEENSHYIFLPKISSFLLTPFFILTTNLLRVVGLYIVRGDFFFLWWLWWETPFYCLEATCSFAAVGTWLINILSNFTVLSNEFAACLEKCGYTCFSKGDKHKYRLPDFNLQFYSVNCVFWWQHLPAA